MIAVHRVYDGKPKARGKRFLVDRVWPRGIRKEDLGGTWVKDAGPSTGLRKWFGHDPARWAEFRKRYRKELDGNPDGWRPLLDAARKGDIVLLFGAKDTERNQAVVLREYLSAKL